MKHLLFLLATVAGGFSACNNSDTTAQARPETVQEPGEQPTVCYTGNSGNDTVNLTVNTTGEKITGSLDYRFYEKDHNSGTIDGRINGDTLTGDYTFKSEGTESVRQVIFLKKDNSLTEGYGDMEEKGGKMVFKNTSSIRFGEGFVLHKTECK
jgi:hypothetical protein